MCFLLLFFRKSQRALPGTVTFYTLTCSSHVSTTSATGLHHVGSKNTFFFSYTSRLGCDCHCHCECRRRRGELLHQKDVMRRVPWSFYSALVFLLYSKVKYWSRPTRPKINQNVQYRVFGEIDGTPPSLRLPSSDFPLASHGGGGGGAHPHLRPRKVWSNHERDSNFQDICSGPKCTLLCLELSSPKELSVFVQLPTCQRQGRDQGCTMTSRRRPSRVMRIVLNAMAMCSVCKAPGN